MKKIAFTFLISLFALFTVAQPGGMKWLPDGNAYTSLDKYSVVKTELPS
jgi:hypothetical protein